MASIKAKTAIVYHYFPHYRKGVIDALRQMDEGVCFMADDDLGGLHSTIKRYVPPDRFYALRLRRIAGGLYWLGGLERALRTAEIESVVLLGDMNSLSAWIVGAFWRLKGKRVLFWAHGWTDESEARGKALLRSIFFRIPNRVLVYGRRARRIAISRGFSPRNVHVIYNSLDYDFQKQIRESMNPEGAKRALRGRFPELALDRGLVLCCARLTRVKRFDVVIDALAAIDPETRPDVLFVGTGPEEENLRELARTNGVDARFAGACYDERALAELFAVADVVVSPGNVGLTAMHAMAYGVSVITHNDRNRQMPEVEAVVSGLTGDFFEFNDPGSLADAIERFFKKSVIEREVMRKACIRMVERFFNPRYQVKKILAALSDVNENERITDTIAASELF